jgi:hypothetical protein
MYAHDTAEYVAGHPERRFAVNQLITDMVGAARESMRSNTQEKVEQISKEILHNANKRGYSGDEFEMNIFYLKNKTQLNAQDAEKLFTSFNWSAAHLRLFYSDGRSSISAQDQEMSQSSLLADSPTFRTLNDMFKKAQIKDANLDFASMLVRPEVFSLPEGQQMWNDYLDNSALNEGALKSTLLEGFERLPLETVLRAASADKGQLLLKMLHNDWDVSLVLSSLVNSGAWAQPQFTDLMERISLSQDTKTLPYLNSVLLNSETLNHAAGLKFLQNYILSSRRPGALLNPELVASMAKDSDFLQNPRGLKIAKILIEMPGNWKKISMSELSGAVAQAPKARFVNKAMDLLRGPLPEIHKPIFCETIFAAQ